MKYIVTWYEQKPNPFTTAPQEKFKRAAKTIMLAKRIAKEQFAGGIVAATIRKEGSSDFLYKRTRGKDLISKADYIKQWEII